MCGNTKLKTKVNFRICNPRRGNRIGYMDWSLGHFYREEPLTLKNTFFFFRDSDVYQIRWISQKLVHIHIVPIKGNKIKRTRMRLQLFWEMYLKILMKKSGKKQSRRTECTTHRIAPYMERLPHQVVCFWIQKWSKLDLHYRQSLSSISKKKKEKKKNPTNPVSLVMTNSKPWQPRVGELVKPHQGGM